MQAPVEQICEVAICEMLVGNTEIENARRIQVCVENAYRNIHIRTKGENKVLIGVTQSINTELVADGDRTLYIITLVGTVVDAAAVELQQRLQQFDPRAALKSLKH